jgi:hypothetical protein
MATGVPNTANGAEHRQLALGGAHADRHDHVGVVLGRTGVGDRRRERVGLQLGEQFGEHPVGRPETEWNSRVGPQ